MMNIREIIGINICYTIYIYMYIFNQHADIWDLQQFRKNCEPLHLNLNIIENSTEEFNSVKDLIPLQSDVRREDSI